jgi:RHS repeat-associated protein
LKVSTTATWTYGWDNLNRMVGVKEVTTTGTQLSVSYSYDVLNNRVEDDTWKASTGTTLTVRHAFDGNNIWADVTTTNTLLARYVYGDGVDQVWARAVPAGQPNSGVAWYLTDREGSVRDIMDSSSVIQDHIDYDGYGNATHTTISFADRQGYAGGQTDLNTGWIQFGGRWYRPSTGDWASEDPIGFRSGDQNLYRYVGNDATDQVDPTGNAAKELRGSLTKDYWAQLVSEQQIVPISWLQRYGEPTYSSALGTVFQYFALKSFNLAGQPLIPFETWSTGLLGGSIGALGGIWRLIYPDVYLSPTITDIKLGPKPTAIKYVLQNATFVDAKGRGVIKLDPQIRGFIDRVSANARASACPAKLQIGSVVFLTYDDTAITPGVLAYATSRKVFIWQSKASWWIKSGTTKPYTVGIKMNKPVQRNVIPGIGNWRSPLGEGVDVRVPWVSRP